MFILNIQEITFEKSKCFLQVKSKEIIELDNYLCVNNFGNNNRQLFFKVKKISMSSNGIILTLQSYGCTVRTSDVEKINIKTLEDNGTAFNWCTETQEKELDKIESYC
jgi:hypothetical protein